MSMTREEAIKFAEHAVNMTDIPDVKEFYRLYTSALRPVSRKQVVKMKKNAVSGQFEDWYGQEFTCPECGHKSLGKGNFCKNCGCPHTDEAVQMVMERLEALYENIHND